MAVADRHGLPVAICVESATPHEVKLATNTLVQVVIPDAPQNLVGDMPMTPTNWIASFADTELN
jgi:hypothetical protein